MSSAPNWFPLAETEAGFVGVRSPVQELTVNDEIVLFPVNT
jgi:hypothetical protein